MTKRLIQNYIFDANAKTISIIGESNISLDKLLLITNITDNEIIFNFADNTKKATIENNIIALQYDTSFMSDSDVLQIFVEDTQPQLIDFSLFFSTIRNLLTRFSFDSSSRIRGIIDVSSLPTVTTVSTVTTANTSFGDAGKIATQQLITQNVVSNSFNRNIVRS